MKHLSDDRITEELENLSQKFKPSRAQKDRAHSIIFQENHYRKKVRIQKWIPTVVTFILLLSIISGAFYLTNDNVLQSNNDVTSDWDGFYVQQTSTNSNTQFTIYFHNGTLIIEDITPYSTSGENFNAEKFKKHITITDTKLIPGKYKEYSVTKNEDAYTIEVKGETEFTYTLNKVAPRKYIGEDGIEYSTSLYLDFSEVITDDITPERLETAPQNEHTFLIEWGSDSMDRGNHDFESHEHGQLVVSTDFDELKRGQAVYYHMPPSVIAKNAAVPEMYIGRVVGLPGETVEINGGQVYIDGKMLDTFYGKATRRGAGEEEYFNTVPSSVYRDEQGIRDYFNMNMAAVTVEENTVFILVDQWWRGYDSREYGPLPVGEIEGIITGIAD
ncbi:signal peptidase I [Sporosarcina sp. Marseille-Q4943]|uniref:signal peptidase I n=1 Tax=Sporosarcina sp. Marseille-Q4943 TaxID=2942204 RepID=UPI00208DB792|nr:signal peptidase I [Sporosarcina sp. Marseille-Q4943]